LKSTGGSQEATLSLPGIILLAYHAVSVLALSWWMGAGLLDTSTLWTCASPSAILWAPIFEELLFRAALFSLALHRSGGNLPLALALSSGVFAALHLPNVLGAGANWAYVGMQVLGAAVCGVTWGVLYARSGRLLEVAALHASNNAAALAWLAAGGSCSLAPPPPSHIFPALISLGFQTALYAACGVVAWRSLQREMEQDGGVTFKARHTLVYGEIFEGIEGTERKKD